MENRPIYAANSPQALKMYFVSPRHYSGIQKGIQGIHSLGEFVLQYFNEQDTQEWLRHYKTAIVLQTNSLSDFQNLRERLLREGVKVGEFFEEDLGDAETSLCFICSEERFDKLSYGLTKFVKSLALATN